MGEDILCVGIKKIFIDLSVYGKGVERGDRCLCHGEQIKGGSDEKLIHKGFDIVDFQCEHSMILLLLYYSRPDVRYEIRWFQALFIIKQNGKKEQSFYKKSFQTEMDMIR